MATILTEYVLTTECRWSFILKYFDGGPMVRPTEANVCCDNCTQR